MVISVITKYKPRRWESQCAEYVVGAAILCCAVKADLSVKRMSQMFLRIHRLHLLSAQSMFTELLVK